jgi:hypothetical protein
MAKGQSINVYYAVSKPVDQHSPKDNNPPGRARRARPLPTLATTAILSAIPAAPYIEKGIPWVDLWASRGPIPMAERQGEWFKGEVWSHSDYVVLVETGSSDVIHPAGRCRQEWSRHQSGCDHHLSPVSRNEEVVMRLKNGTCNW